MVARRIWLRPYQDVQVPTVYGRDTGLIMTYLPDVDAPGGAPAEIRVYDDDSVGIEQIPAGGSVKVRRSEAMTTSARMFIHGQAISVVHRLAPLTLSDGATPQPRVTACCDRSIIELPADHAIAFPGSDAEKLINCGG